MLPVDIKEYMILSFLTLVSSMDVIRAVDDSVVYVNDTNHG